MAIRMKDIAEDLNLSVVTISKVLRNHTDIGEETRQRVLNRIKELNYQPNYAARALATGRTMSIGLIVPDLVHAFFAEVAKGVSAVVRKHGYGLLIASSEENPELEREEIQQMLARHVDAIIIASAQRNTESFRHMEQRNTPYVLIDRHFEGFTANFVGVNDLLAGELATEHLIAVGCRNIAHIRGPEVSTAVERLAGYKRALSRNGLPLRSSNVIVEPTGDERGDDSGYHAMDELFKRNSNLDGLFCYNDPTAMGAMQRILEAGLRIPEDIAVIGCGNVRYAHFLRIPLSSVDQGSSAIGKRAGRLALSLTGPKKATEPKVIQLEPKVVVRASTARQPAARPR